MNIKEILNEGKEILSKQNFLDSNIISKDILAMLLKVDKQYLIINNDKNIDDEIYLQFKNKINDIINGIPLQYITHKQEFMGYEFFVDENVLIPQPDTEIVVQKVIDIYNLIFKGKKEVKILDLCTGSGAIAISLDKILSKYKNTKIFASDISEKALEIANKNNYNLKSNVAFIKSDLFKDIDTKFDIIVSNPPYIQTNIIKTLSKDVQREPHLALDGGNDGLKFYRSIITDAYKYLNNSGYICLEIGYDQKDSVIKLLTISEKYNNIQNYKDLSNNDRCIIAKKGK